MCTRNTTASDPSAARTNVQRLALGGTAREVVTTPEEGKQAEGALRSDWSDASR